MKYDKSLEGRIWMDEEFYTSNIVNNILTIYAQQ